VRWWLQTSPPYLMSVDNASTRGMDFSDLLTAEPDIWMVQWAEGKGEIERLKINSDNTVENLNGLRETFIDVVPYAPYFQQFLQLMQAKALLLPQAKKIDIDLIREIFESKRQAPFHYPVAAGDYWWDATDETLMSSTVGAIQNATASLNAVIAALNTAIAHINASLVPAINTNAGIGNTLVAQINATIVGGVNSAVVGGVNGFVGTYNAAIATYNAMGDAHIAYINGMLGSYTAGGVTINLGLTKGSGDYAQGLAYADVPHSTQSWQNPYTQAGIGGIGAIGPGNEITASNVPGAGIPPVSVANAQWIPIGATAPVNVTPAEQAGILNGITARTNALNVKKNIKIGQVNALTTVQAVIDYDVTTGW
jgi:hypothetical protein